MPCICSLIYPRNEQDDGSSHWVSLGGGSTKNITAGSVPFTVRCTVTRGGMTAEGMLSVYVSGGGGFKGSVSGLPEAFALRANFPNPFNPETIIRYEIPEHSAVKLQIYDRIGRVVECIIRDNASGLHPQTNTAKRKEFLWNYFLKNTATATTL